MSTTNDRASIRGFYQSLIIRLLSNWKGSVFIQFFSIQSTWSSRLSFECSLRIYTFCLLFLYEQEIRWGEKYRTKWTTLVAEVRMAFRVVATLRAHCTKRRSEKPSVSSEPPKRLFCERRRKTKLKINDLNTRVGWVSTDNECAVWSAAAAVKYALVPSLEFDECRWHEEIALNREQSLYKLSNEFHMKFIS